jgi:hypothetical protein
MINKSLNKITYDESPPDWIYLAQQSNKAVESAEFNFDL